MASQLASHTVIGDRWGVCPQAGFVSLHGGRRQSSEERVDFVDVDVGGGGALAYDPRVRWTPYAHAPKGVTERSKGPYCAV